MFCVFTAQLKKAKNKKLLLKMVPVYLSIWSIRKEGNVFFNDELNTFYLLLYSVG